MKTTLKMETFYIVWYIVDYLKKGDYGTWSHTAKPYSCLHLSFEYSLWEGWDTLTFYFAQMSITQKF